MASLPSPLCDMYTKLEKLGEGGFGVVFKVEHKLSKQLLALKSVSIEIDARRKLVESEVNILKQCDHPNIVKFVEHFYDDTRIFIVMELCSNGDLKAAIAFQKQSGRPFSEEQLLSWFLDLFHGIKYLHDLHIIHRDIKPGNILLTECGSIKISDFGLSKILDFTSDLAKSKAGTQVYMAPEVILGRRYNMKADIWSLGVCGYEMLSFRKPFKDQGDVLDYLYFKFDYEQLSLHTHPFLVLLVQQMLKQDESKRPTNSEVLQQLLEHKSKTDKEKFEIEEMKYQIIERDQLQLLLQKKEEEVASTTKKLEKECSSRILLQNCLRQLDSFLDKMELQAINLEQNIEEEKRHRLSTMIKLQNSREENEKLLDELQTLEKNIANTKQQTEELQLLLKKREEEVASTSKKLQRLNKNLENKLAITKKQLIDARNNAAKESVNAAQLDEKRKSILKDLEELLFKNKH